jgi:hypothetical protein
MTVNKSNILPPNEFVDSNNRNVFGFNFGNSHFSRSK